MSEHRGACLLNDYFCVLCVTLDATSGCVARLPLLSISQSNWAACCGLKIFVYMLW